tara:strand:- start:11994 stop:12416 length:423 start_codon:yes stop_codon:yes gene_type:complete
MDINKLFQPFLDTPRIEPEMESEMEDYKTSPKYKLKMFTKFTYSNHIFREKVIKFFISANPDMDPYELLIAGEYMAYNRSWFWISQFILDDLEWVEGLKQIENKELTHSLDLTIKYFEKHSEFEKCAFLVKIKNLALELK